MSAPILHATRGASSRYWVLVHAGVMHRLTWADGERLLALTCDVRTGISVEQDFAFLPKECHDESGTVVVTVRADEPLELFTEYEPENQSAPSHWFG